MTGNERILEAARAARAYLPELIPDDHAEVDRELAALLRDVDRDPGAVDRILAVFEDHVELKEWTAAFMERGYPEDVAEEIERYDGELPGRGIDLPGTKFVCPQGDYAWYRRMVGQAVPEECPTHHVPLRRAL
jgi:hypothetical protein